MIAYINLPNVKSHPLKHDNFFRQRLYLKVAFPNDVSEYHLPISFQLCKKLLQSFMTSWRNASEHS